ncbi:MAG TPA: hypothetical protein VFM68_02860 [Candidatus Saccharimonadales bacterium]|nr:hypothetical protein [Candidatus Saccharimonadales bacterium]
MNATEQAVSIFWTTTLSRQTQLSYKNYVYNQETGQWNPPVTVQNDLSTHGVMPYEILMFNNRDAEARLLIECTPDEQGNYPLLGDYAVPGFDSSRFHDDDRLKAVRLWQTSVDNPAKKIDSEKPTNARYEQRLTIAGVVELTVVNDQGSRRIQIYHSVHVFLPSGRIRLVE